MINGVMSGLSNGLLSGLNHVDKPDLPIPGGFHFWYSAKNVEVSGTSITTIYDVSSTPKNLTQTTAIRQPSYVSNYINGRPAIYFDGTKWIYNVSFPSSLPQPLTIYVVHQWTAPQSLRYITCGPIDNRNYAYYCIGSANLRFLTEATTAIQYAKSFPYAMQTTRIVANAGSSQVYENGVLVGSASIGNIPLNGIILGANKDFNTSRLFIGYICDVLCYGQQSSLDVLSVENYFKTEYNHY